MAHRGAGQKQNLSARLGKLSTEADILSGNPKSATYVQEAIGSRSSAIHKDYRASLRPSQVLEPRHPSLKVVEVGPMSFSNSLHKNLNAIATARAADP